MDIKLPPLTMEQKKEIKAIRERQGMGSVLERIRKITELDLRDSKILAIDVNEAGHCNRCNYDKLQGENQICPKCKSFNLNWE
jgi:predicted Zn-ribbon and HTH transcriptional regulator